MAATPDDAEFGEAVDQHIENLTKGLNMLLQAIPMPGEALQDTYDPQLLEIYLIQSAFEMAKTVRRRITELRRSNHIKNGLS